MSLIYGLSFYRVKQDCCVKEFKNNMKLILHIGSPKTGTTTLQNSLYGNHDQLIKNKVLYPRLKNRKNHNSLSLLYRNNPPTREFMQNGLKTPEEYKTEADNIFNTIKRKIDIHSPNYVVLSGEYFFFKLNEDQIADLQNRLSAIFDEIKVVCYLRDPVDYYSSFSLQVLKASYELRGPFSPTYKEILSSYSTGFDIDARRFNRKSLIGADIVSDFIDTYIPALNGIIQSSRSNETISANSLALISQYRKTFHTDENDIFNPQSQKLYQIFQKIEKEADLYEKPQLHSWVKDYIYSQFIDDNTYLHQNHGINFMDGITINETTPKVPSKRYSIEELYEINEDTKNKLILEMLKYVASLHL